MGASEAEERAQFMLAMRARRIDDLDLLRALERVPRALFMPQRFADMSGKDIALPIGCGQSSPPPSVLAAMIAALDISPRHRVCEIGAGSGYCTALIAQLAAEVVTLERFQTLALEASARLSAFGLGNVAVLWRDGFDFHESGERFDRVIVHGVVEPPALAFVKLIGQEGSVVTVFAGPGKVEQRIVCLTVRATGPVALSDHGPARAFLPLASGLARAL